MLSRKMIILLAVVIFIAFNFIVLTMSSRKSIPSGRIERISISIISPFQSAVQSTISYTKEVWTTYFLSAFASQENALLKAKLEKANQLKNRYVEMEKENARLKKLVNFTTSIQTSFVAAQVVGRDPSPWYKTIMIDKGSNDGVSKGDPVVVSEGIVGQIIKVSDKYSSVLLIIDRNSAVDSLIQSTRVSGIVKGDNNNNCFFVYALKQEEIKTGQIIISSGLDQVFPKGLRVGRVTEVEKKHSQLFQRVAIETFVDFNNLEEVLVARNFR